MGISSFLENHRYTLMALLSAAILIGSGISLGVGLFGSQATEVEEATNAPKVSGIQIGDDLSDQKIIGKININKANEDELSLLYGIKSARAKAIIEYRSKNGYFTSIAEIQNVSGIGPKTFEKIKDLIVIE